MNTTLIYRGAVYQQAESPQLEIPRQSLPGKYRGVAVRVPAEMSGTVTGGEQSLRYRGATYSTCATGATWQPAL